MLGKVKNKSGPIQVQLPFESYMWHCKPGDMVLDDVQKLESPSVVSSMYKFTYKLFRCLWRMRASEKCNSIERKKICHGEQRVLVSLLKLLLHLNQFDELVLSPAGKLAVLQLLTASSDAMHDMRALDRLSQ